MLTPKQCAALLFIHRHIDENGVPPSFDEMRKALSLGSKSGVHRLVSGLEERGFIRRLPNRARALEVLRLPGTQPSIAMTNSDVGSLPIEFVSVPIMGRIAAGAPIEAVQTHRGAIPIAAVVLGSGEHFALEVQGDSMVGAGILDGDTVVIRRCDTAETGEIVVALVDEEEATLKRIRLDGLSIALEAANPDYPVRLLRRDRVRIQGRLITLVRRYPTAG